MTCFNSWDCSRWVRGSSYHDNTYYLTQQITDCSLLFLFFSIFSWFSFVSALSLWSDWSAAFWWDLWACMGFLGSDWCAPWSLCYPVLSCALQQLNNSALCALLSGLSVSCAFLTCLLYVFCLGCCLCSDLIFSSHLCCCKQKLQLQTLPFSVGLSWLFIWQSGWSCNISAFASVVSVLNLGLSGYVTLVLGFLKKLLRFTQFLLACLLGY